MEKLEIVKDRSEAAPNFLNSEFSRGFHCDLRSQNKFEQFSKYSISQEFINLKRHCFKDPLSGFADVAQLVEHFHGKDIVY